MMKKNLEIRPWLVRAGFCVVTIAGLQTRDPTACRREARELFHLMNELRFELLTSDHSPERELYICATAIAGTCRDLFNAE